MQRKSSLWVALFLFGKSLDVRVFVKKTSIYKGLNGIVIYCFIDKTCVLWYSTIRDKVREEVFSLLTLKQMVLKFEDRRCVLMSNKAKENKVSHPSYGTLAFRRRSGGATPLFGSSIEHKDTIAMTLYHAGLERCLNSDNIFANKAIVEVEMSYSQFAEAITSMNVGCGVPVTIRWTEKDGAIPPCDFIGKREQFVNEFKEQRKEVTAETQQLISDVKELFAKKSLTKADREDVLNKLSRINLSVGCNIDFMAEMFNEQIDRTITEAKGEIEAFCQNKINSIASAALIEHKDEVLGLENPVEL